MTSLFPTPYGQAIDRTALSVFGRLVDLPGGRCLVTTQPIVDRATQLVDAYIDLMAWQQAYDHYEWFSHPTDYEEGRVELIPPRRIEDVLTLRAFGSPVPADPTAALDGDLAQMLKRVKALGPTALEVPF